MKTLKTFLGRVIRDIARRIAGNEALEKLFAHPLMLARRVPAQNKNLRRLKGPPEGADLRVFRLHAPEVEGIGKAPKPYEFWRRRLAIQKAGSSSSTPRPRRAKPSDGHTLGTVIPEIEKQIGVSLKRIFATPATRPQRTARASLQGLDPGQKRKANDAIKRETRRRAAIEPLGGRRRKLRQASKEAESGRHGVELF